ncbi:MAG TPA: hypothetical protein VL346_01155 [Acidobacteriaceae bacterium]|nr:hypothetical protein [Acidobacteriaceae bacterium]
MADIGSNMSRLDKTGLERGLSGENAQPLLGDLPPLAEKNKPVTHHRQSLWESLTASLDLACRGYLCMQVVDCDPVSDPECSAAGKKVVVREVPAAAASSAAGREQDSPQSRDAVHEIIEIHRMI